MSAVPPWFSWPPIDLSSVGGVNSFNGRTGAVVPANGDYGSDAITNQSSEPGATVTNALNNLKAGIALVAYPPTGYAVTTVWNPDAPPLVPSVWDDECNGSVIDPKWSTFDPAGYLSAAAHPTQGGYYTLQGLGNGADRFAALYQAKPATEFCFCMKLSVLASTFARWLQFGAMLGESFAVPATAQLEIYRAVYGNPGAAADFFGQAQSWTKYDTPAADHGIMPNGGQNTTIYIMGRVNGTAYNYDISSDGISWFAIGGTTVGYTLANFGVGINVTTGTRGIKLHWFRVLGTGSGSATYGALAPGRDQQILVAT